MIWGLPQFGVWRTCRKQVKPTQDATGKLGSMLEAFRRHLEESGLLPPGLKVLVGYSGGADSTCLLHLLVACGADVVAAHLHHGQRAEADDELDRCKRFAETLGVPFAAGRADVPRMSKERKVGLEEAGRLARYEFFAQASAQFGCDLVATAHTRSDHVETVLLHLVRGSGLAGLAGIPGRRGNLIRPFLPFTREQTRAYCEEHGLWFHDDPANADVEFARSRIRHHVVPALKLINPAVEDAVARLAALAGDEDRFLDGMAAASLEHAERPLNGDLSFLTHDVEVAFDLARIAVLPAALLRRAIRLVAGTLGSRASHDQAHTLALVLQSETKGSITFDGGECVVEWDRGLLHFRKLHPSIPSRTPLPEAGTLDSAEFGWSFEISRGSGPERLARASLETSLDRSKIKGPLYIRTAEPGDAMHPLGFDGTRKVSDLFSDSKLTQAARKRLPIVCDLVGPVWAPGVCLDARAAPASGSPQATFLRFSRVAHPSQP